MALTTNLVADVPKTTRLRGREYYAARRVKLVEGDDFYVEARVRGTRDYTVELFREPDAIEAGCTCPYFADARGACKHIWATLLLAEAEGYLKGTGYPPPAHLELLDPDELDEAMDDSLWETPQRTLPASRSR